MCLGEDKLGDIGYELGLPLRDTNGHKKAHPWRGAAATTQGIGTRVAF